MYNNIYGKEIIELLKEQNLQIDSKLENIIGLIAFEIFTKGKEEGIKEGVDIGINKTCREFEVKISAMRSKINNK
jgi:hypothetical protein